MKIMITGNMGYVGSSLVEHFRTVWPEAIIIGYDTGYFAHVLCNSKIFPECLLDCQYFRDIRQVPPQLLADLDSIVHLSGISNDPIGNIFEAVTDQINFQASIDLAQQAKTAGVRSFVFASSCSVYGFASDSPRKESDALNPLTAYARSKVNTEMGLQKLADSSFTVTCLRFATACGMSKRLRLDLVLNDFVANALAKGGIEILSDGTPWRPLIHVKDMARAIEWAIRRNSRDSSHFIAVNTGSNKWNYQIKDLARAVAEIIPGTPVSINPEAPPDKRSYQVNFDLFAELAPEHQPIHDLHYAILEILEGLQAMGFNDPDFRNSSYIRLRVLKDLIAGGYLDNNLKWQHKSPTELQPHPNLFPPPTRVYRKTTSR